MSDDLVRILRIFSYWQLRGGPVKRTLAIAAVTLGLAAPLTAVAGTLQENLFNLNGTTYHNTYAVPGLNSVGWNDTTGLGTLTLTFNPGAAGSYFFDAFFDHQLHAPFYNEYGAVAGAPGAGISWQIDEPGFGDGNRLGTIFDNVLANALDNLNHIPGTLSNFLNDCGGNTPGNPPDPACNNDVSMAFGFNFVLAANELAVITLSAVPTMPTSGFFLRQHDPDTLSDVFLIGSISIRPVSTAPEPGTLLLIATAIVALARSIRARSALTART
jgi:hypothetical protein